MTDIIGMGGMPAHKNTKQIIATKKARDLFRELYFKYRTLGQYVDSEYESDLYIDMNNRNNSEMMEIVKSYEKIEPKILNLIEYLENRINKLLEEE